MINNILNNGVNTCTPNGGAGNQSPEPSWTPGKRGTKSYVVTMYDVTAVFTHGGMYNISPETTSLPENAGVAGSAYSTQIFDDFFAGLNTMFRARPRRKLRLNTTTLLLCTPSMSS